MAGELAQRASVSVQRVGCLRCGDWGSDKEPRLWTPEERAVCPTLFKACSFVFILCPALVRVAWSPRCQGPVPRILPKHQLVLQTSALASYFLELDHLEALGRRLGHTTNPQRYRQSNHSWLRGVVLEDFGNSEPKCKPTKQKLALVSGYQVKVSISVL